MPAGSGLYLFLASLLSLVIINLVSCMSWLLFWTRCGRKHIGSLCFSPFPRSCTCAVLETVCSKPVKAEVRTPLPLFRMPSRRLIALEQGRGDHLHPPLDFFQYLREPRCPKELVRAFPMTSDMKPHLVLVHRLCAHRYIYLLFAPSTHRVRDEVAVLHESTLLMP